jgi:hypothetical protein
MGNAKLPLLNGILLPEYRDFTGKITLPQFHCRVAAARDAYVSRAMARRMMCASRTRKCKSPYFPLERAYRACYSWRALHASNRFGS